MGTNTEYLRGIAENTKWPAMMREQIELAAEEIDSLRADKRRIDWLADTKTVTGNVQLPRDCVERNMHCMRSAIDDAMRIEFLARGSIPRNLTLEVSRVSEAKRNERRLDRLVRWLACSVIGCQYRVVRRMNADARKVACSRCRRAWAMHDPTRSFLPWDSDFESFYAKEGPLNHQPSNAKVSGAGTASAGLPGYAFLRRE